MRLTPLHDVTTILLYESEPPPLSVRPDPTVSDMKIGSQWTLGDVTTADWIEVARKLGVDRVWAIERVEQLRSDIASACAVVAQGLPTQPTGAGMRNASPMSSLPRR